jgi:uncharacterized protein (DUF58 family)
VTRRGRGIAVLAACAYACAWAFGSEPLAVVGLGLAAATALAWAAVRLASGPVTLRRGMPAGPVREGDDVRLSLELSLAGRVPASSVSLRERLGGEAREILLARSHGAYRGGYTLRSVARGRYVAADATVAVSDPLSIAARETMLPAGSPLVVYPRLVELDRLFSDVGAAWWDGRRLLLRRAAGFELHTVRDYERGDSLRAVHWRSTAKRGELMVKELEDSPRAEVAVVLDCHAMPALGTAPETPFDTAVRAAGSMLAAHVRRGRAATLVLNGRVVERIGVATGKAWGSALERLATVEPDGVRDVAASVEQPPITHVPELTVVTAGVTPRLASALVDRAAARRRAALVLVDGASFDGRARGRDRELLRLAAAGVPVAVVRRGDDLRAALSAPELASADHA